MTDTKKAAGCGDTQAAFNAISEKNFTPILGHMKAVLYRLALWLFAVGVA